IWPAGSPDTFCRSTAACSCSSRHDGAGRQQMPWAYDAGHSQVAWSVKYVGLSLVYGLFRKMDVDLNVEGDDPTQWRAKVTIQAASVESGVDRRDEVMRGEEYFDVEKYPTITWESKSVARDGDGFRAVGDATLHGTTRE